MGFIYILSHPTFDENVFKIGLTKDLKSRLVSFNTSCPHRSFSFAFTTEIPNDSLRAFERFIHFKLHEFHVSGEFFNLPLNDIIDTINKYITLPLEDLVVTSNKKISVPPEKEKKIIHQSDQYSHICHKCNKAFQYKYLLSRHLNGKLNCESKNISYQNVDINMKRSSKCDTAGCYKCEFCNCNFSFKTNLRRHKLKCKSKSDIICIFENKLDIKPISVEQYKCRFCKLKLATQPSYSRHMSNGCKEKELYKIKLQKQIDDNENLITH